MLLATLLLWAVTPLLICNAIVVLELLASWRRPALRAVVDETPRLAVLIPAHNEELAIAETVTSVLQTTANARVVVVADNCSDATASNAHAAGAEVIVRNDLTATGKGHALDFGRSYLARHAPDCVVLLDADTIPAPLAINRLAASALARDTVVQGAYWLEPHRDASMRVRVSAAAFFVTNVLRQRGLQRIARACVLTGSGIAAPWRHFARLPLATSHLAEDLMLGLWCLRYLSPPAFIADAFFVAPTSGDRGTTTQRDRWESGRRDLVRRNVGPLLRLALDQMRWAPAWVAARLLVPPLAVLAAANVVILAVLATLILWAIPTTLALTALATAFAILLVALPVALVRARRTDFVAALLHAPVYVVWQIGRVMARRLRPPTHWQRTERDER